MRRKVIVLLLATVAISVPVATHANDDLVRGIFGAILGGAIQGAANQGTQQRQGRQYENPENYPGQPRYVDELTELRAQIQRRLNALGFIAGYPDGVFGSQTRQAIAQFQRSSGFPVTGKITTAQISALYRKTGGALPSNVASAYDDTQQAAVAPHPAAVETDDPPATEVASSTQLSQQTQPSADDDPLTSAPVLKAIPGTATSQSGAEAPQAATPSTAYTAEQSRDNTEANSAEGAVTQLAAIKTTNTPAEDQNPPAREVSAASVLPASASNNAPSQQTTEESPATLPPLVTPAITPEPAVVASADGSLSLTYVIKPGTFKSNLATVDILGLKLGMTPEKVTAAMSTAGYQASSPSTNSIVYPRKVNGVELKVDGPNTYTESLAFSRHDDNLDDNVQVSFVSPLNGNAAYKINRKIRYRKDEVKPDGKQFVGTLFTKYSEPSDTKSSVKQVDMSGGGMSGYMSGVLGTTEYARYDQLETWWYFSGGKQAKTASGYDDKLYIQVFGTAPTLDEINMDLFTKDIGDKDASQRKAADEEAMQRTKSVPRNNRVMPKL
jgi:peptidoglycan hydrolase-like protein with peptidoglycan-binding domain